MVKKTEVDVTLSQLINDLNNGHVWLAKDDEGFGSIQAKYKASDIEILTIKKHPKLAGIEPSVTVLRIIDDLDGGSTQSILPAKEKEKPADTNRPTVAPEVKRVEPGVQAQSPVVSVAGQSSTVVDSTPVSNAKESEDSFDSL